MFRATLSSLAPIMLAASLSVAGENGGGGARAVMEPVARLPAVDLHRAFSGFSPDEELLTAKRKLWEVATGRLVAEVESPGAFVFSPEGVPLEVAWHASMVRVREVLSGRTTLTVPGAEPHLASLLAPCARSVPLLLVPALVDESSVDLWDVAAGKRLLSLQNPELHRDLVEAVCLARHKHNWLVLSQDGSRLAWLSPRRDIYVWDLGTSNEKPRIVSWSPHGQGTRGRARSDLLVISPDGALLAGVEYSTRGRTTATIRIWRLSTGKQCCAIRQDVTGGTGAYPHMLHVSFSLSGEELLTMLFPVIFPPSAEVAVWETETGRRLWRYPLKSVDDFRSFSRSKHVYVLAHGGHCRFWPLRSCETMSHGLNSAQWFRSRLAVSGDGFLLSFPVKGPDRTAVREIASQLPIAHLSPDPTARAIAFSPNGRYLVASSRGSRYRDETLVWDLRRPLPAQRPLRRDLSRLLVDLRGNDAAGAQRAVRCLISIGDPVVRELAAEWPPVATAERIGELIRQLDDPNFAVRERATSKLIEIGPAAEEAVRRAFSDSPSLEVRHRAKKILGKLERHAKRPDVLFEMRAVQVLAGIGSEAAREVLRRVSDRSPDDRVAASARLSLARLQRNSKQPANPFGFSF